VEEFARSLTAAAPSTVEAYRRDLAAFVTWAERLGLSSPGDVQPVLEAVAERMLAERPGGEIDRTDGVKLRWRDSWVHLRSSNTEPIIRVIGEARTPAAARALVDRALAAHRTTEEQA